MYFAKFKITTISVNISTLWNNKVSIKQHCIVYGDNDCCHTCINKNDTSTFFFAHALQIVKFYILLSPSIGVGNGTDKILWKEKKKGKTSCPIVSQIVPEYRPNFVWIRYIGNILGG